MLSQHCYRFVHRQNEDGTFDAICIECFETVAFAVSEPEIVGLERTHSCISEDRSRFDAWRKKYQPQNAANIRHFKLPPSA